jgi:TRAP-type C4-dicarboxylate transport system permease small subunit
VNRPDNEAVRPLAWLRRVERWTAAGLVGVILTLMAAQVVARYVFRAPIPWSEEVACFAFVWLAFIGGALVAGEEKLLTVDVVSPLVGRRGRLAVECIATLAVVACCMLMVAGGVPFVRRLGGIGSPAAGIPRRWWYLASALGLSLIALHAVVNAVAALRRGSVEWSEDDGGTEEPEGRSALP